MSLADEGPNSLKFLQRLPPVLVAWLPVLGIVGATLGLTIVLHWTAAATAVELWITRSAYNHGFLILPISVYLLWERRHALAVLKPEPNAWGAFGVLAVSFVWLFAHSAGLMEGEHFVIVALFQVIVMTLLGFRFYWAMLLPMNYLWLMVPTGTLFYPILQGIAVTLTTFFLKLSGIPTFSEGIQVLVPTGLYFIAEGCAGLNFIMTTLALAPLYAMFIYTSMRKRIIAVGVALALSVIANAFRIAVIIALAEFTNRRIDIVDDHLLYGWGFFAVILALLGWIGLRFADPHEDAGGEETADQSVPEFNFRPLLITAALTWAALMALPAYNAIVRAPASSSIASTSVPPPGFERISHSDYPHYPNADGVNVWKDRSSSANIALAYYGYQTDERSSFASDNQDYDARRWPHVSKSYINVERQQSSVPFQLIRLDTATEKRLIAKTHWVGGTFTTSKTRASLLQAKADLTMSDRRSAVLIVSLPVSDGNWDQAREVFSAWVVQSSILSHIESGAFWDQPSNTLVGE